LARIWQMRRIRTVVVPSAGGSSAGTFNDDPILTGMSWSEAEEIFTGQHNVASRRQLCTVFTPNQIDGFVRHGRLVAKHWGVYHHAGIKLCSRGEAMAALLRCPEGSAITGPLVLGLLNVNGFSDSDAFEVLVPEGSRVRRVNFRVRLNPTPAPTRMLGVLRIAAPARALVDSGRPSFECSDDLLWTGYDSARWQRLITTSRFVAELERSGPRDAGANRWRAIADERSLTSESPKERELDETLQQFDPVPEQQVYVTPRRRVDFFWRSIRLAIEYLGKAAHSHGPGRAADAVRDEELEGISIRTLYVVQADLAEPAALTAWLIAAVERRAAELGVRPPVRRT
jgi:hypothetical protein